MNETKGIPNDLYETALPRAYNGCTCACHSHPNVHHVVACCRPQAALSENENSDLLIEG